MWKSIIINIVLSIVIILIGQRIWDYFKTNYTTKKTKNLVEFQSNKYKTIMEELERNLPPLPVAVSASTKSSHPPSLGDTNFLSREEKEWLAKELDGYLNSL